MMASVPAERDGPQSHSELLKVEYAPVMAALYRSIRRFCTPGVRSGTGELADLLEINEHALRNQFGPTSYDHAPTVHKFLRVLEAVQSREAAHEISALADCATIPRSIKAGSVGAPADDAQAFAALGGLVERRLRATRSRLDAGRPLSVPERTAARDALFDIVAYAAHLITRVR